MEMTDNQRRQEILDAITGMKYDFAQQEAFFLDERLARVRLNDYEETARALERRLVKSRQKARERLEHQIHYWRSLHQQILDCLDLRTRDKERFKEEKNAAFRTAQAMNFGIFAVHKTLERIKFRPESLDVIEEITRRYLDGKNASKEIEFQMAYMRNHLNYQMRLRRENVLPETILWVRDKLVEE